MERQRNVFMLQNGCKINEFCVKVRRLSFVPQLLYQKDMKCSRKILKLFIEALKQQKHRETLWRGIDA